MSPMTHVVTSNCQRCMYTDCVETCPVDCFFDAGSQLVIDPELCIDCAACIAACPVAAIYADDELPAESAREVLRFNAERSAAANDLGDPPVTEKRMPLPTADDRRRELGFE